MRGDEFFHTLIGPLKFPKQSKTQAAEESCVNFLNDPAGVAEDLVKKIYTALFGGVSQIPNPFSFIHSSLKYLLK